jgi:LysR family transcriptional activator of glutamate synthase operon
MDIRRLRHIITIAHFGNMTRAAEACFIYQSSLSQNLAKLENELGTPLFYRNHGKLTLTPAGKLYVEAANKVIKIHDELNSRIKNNQYKKLISVGVTTHFALKMLGDILPILKKECPDVTVEIVEGNITSTAALLHEDKIDCAIMALNKTNAFASEQVTILKDEEIFFLIPKSHPFAASHPSGSITLQQLKDNFSGKSFILSGKGSTLRELTNLIFAKEQIPVNPVCEVNNVALIREIVSKGLGVSILSETNVVENPNIVYYPFEPKLYRKDCFIERRDWVKSLPETEFKKLVLNYFPKEKK